MVINKDTYVLGVNNYIKSRHSKQQILLASTFSDNMKHFNGWKVRHGGNFKRTAPFTIDIKGNIYQHYPPEYYSNFFGISDIDQHIIPILIENEGWLVKLNETYINYCGNPYNRKDLVMEMDWRGQKFWAPYNNKQLNATVELCKYLTKDFPIELETVGHNTKFDGIYDYNGIVYKSNYEKRYTDLSPAWDCKKFKTKLELK